MVAPAKEDGADAPLSGDWVSANSGDTTRWSCLSVCPSSQSLRGGSPAGRRLWQSACTAPSLRLLTRWRGLRRNGILFRELRIIGLHARFVGCNLRLHPVEATLYNVAVGTFTTGRDLCTINLGECDIADQREREHRYNDRVLLHGSCNSHRLGGCSGIPREVPSARLSESLSSLANNNRLATTSEKAEIFPRSATALLTARCRFRSKPGCARHATMHATRRLSCWLLMRER